MSSPKESRIPEGNLTENRERPLGGKVALVTGISQVFCAQAAIALAQEGAQVTGIVGNSRKEQEEARKLAMHIEYSGNGIVDIVRVDLTSPEDRKRLQRAVREEIDILVVSSGTNEEARSKGSDAWAGMLPKMAKGGTVILIGEDNKEEQLSKSRIPEFQEKGVSFIILCPPDAEDSPNEFVGEKVVELLKQ